MPALRSKNGGMFQLRSGAIKNIHFPPRKKDVCVETRCLFDEFIFVVNQDNFSSVITPLAPVCVHVSVEKQCDKSELFKTDPLR